MTRFTALSLTLALVTVAGKAVAEDCFNSPEDEYLYTSNEPSPLRVTDDEMAALLARIRRYESVQLAARSAVADDVATAQRSDASTDAD